MEIIGYAERMCDFCEEKKVGLVLDPRPILAQENKCLENNIIPSGVNVMFTRLIRAKRDEGIIVALPILGISVVLCKECSLKNREEALNIIIEKPRILQEAIRSRQISIDVITQDISEREKEKEALIGKIKNIVTDVRSKKQLLTIIQKSKKRLGEDLRKK